MKLIYLIITVIATVLMAMATSIALDWGWIQAEPARIIIVYLLMVAVLVVGFLITKEILKN